MQIGRRLFFDKSSGVVVCDTGEMQGDVGPTQPADDMGVFPALVGRTLGSDTDYIELAYGDQSGEIDAAGSLVVNPITKALTIYPHLSIAVDKAQITANGSDTATVTVTVADQTSTDPITFAINGGSGNAVPLANGAASITFTTQVAGAYTIQATSQKYGAGSVQVSGV